MNLYNNIPEELKALDNWCAFSIQERNGKKTKFPINANTGTYAKSNDPSTWSSFEKAIAAIHKYSDCVGIGFFFNPPYFGIDIDNIHDDIQKYKSGNAENIVSEFVEYMQSYTEYSISGNGIHIICKGELPKGGRRKANVEMYDSGRFFCMTGNIASDYKTINEDEYQKINYLHAKYIGSDEQQPESKKINSGTDLEIHEIIDLALKGKNAMRFRVFLEGGWDQFFSSHSEADLSFCNDLAFWTNRNAEKMDAIFRSSALFRDKWDEKRGAHTYGETTIEKAISSCKNVYEKHQEEIQITSYSYDDTGNAQRFYDRYKPNIRYNYSRKNWVYYDSKKWTIDETGRMKILVDHCIKEMKKESVYVSEEMDEKEAKKAFSRHIKATRNNKGKVNMLKEAEHLLPITSDKFDTDIHLLNVQNGYIDLKTGELHEHDKSKFFTKIAHVEYTEKIDCPLWLQFLNEIFDNDQSLINYLQRLVGYSLSGSTQEQQMFILYGNGRNGKSVFLDIITEMLGSYATNIQPQSLMIKQQSTANSDIARLNGARLVTTTESNDGARFDEGLVKQLTGGDMVTARFLYENEFNFMPQFKLWMATNHKPIIRGSDDGIWRRLVVIPFTVQIPDNKVDKLLKYKLRGELKGILQWAVEGFLQWQKYGLQEPSTVTRERADYRTEMDAISQFLEECCDPKETNRIQSSKLYSIYKTWAHENNAYLMSNSKFSREMSKKFQKIRSNGSYFIGLALKDEYEKPFLRLNF